MKGYKVKNIGQTRYFDSIEKAFDSICRTADTENLEGKIHHNIMQNKGNIPVTHNLTLTFFEGALSLSGEITVRFTYPNIEGFTEDVYTIEKIIIE